LKWSIALDAIAEAISNAQKRRNDWVRYQTQHMKNKKDFEDKADKEQQEIDNYAAKITIEDVTIGSLKALQEGFVAHADDQPSE
jgi:hypothetical protein